jgi:hypothetical protein
VGVVYLEDEVGRWGNWRKVADGTCHGCFVTNLYADEAMAAGLKALEIEPYGFIGNVTLTTTQDIIERRPDAVDTLVAAAFAASELFQHDRAAALAIMRNGPQQMMNDEQHSAIDLERTYEILRSELSAQPVPSPEGLVNTRRMSLPIFPELSNFNPLGMWDLTFAKRSGLG